MSAYARLELHRLSDDLVYTFTRATHPDGTGGYQRDDANIWMVYRPALGWVVIDPVTREVTGKAWDVPPQEQSEARPPDCDWVSKKGVKSCVYRLRYLA